MSAHPQPQFVNGPLPTDTTSDVPEHTNVALTFEGRRVIIAFDCIALVDVERLDDFRSGGDQAEPTFHMTNDWCGHLIEELLNEFGLHYVEIKVVSYAAVSLELDGFYDQHQIMCKVDATLTRLEQSPHTFYIYGHKKATDTAPRG